MVRVGYTEDGMRVGETHPRAKLMDHEVELIRDMHEKYSMGYKKLAQKFEVSIRTIRGICNYTARVTSVARFGPPKNMRKVNHGEGSNL